MSERTIGIFTAQKDASDGVPASFFGCDDKTLLALLYQHAAEVAGPGMTKYDPADGDLAKLVGQIVVQPVDDDTLYKVNAEVGKPEVNRKPDGDVGTWAIQSLVFSKDTFTVDEAKGWIDEHSDTFGDYGVDETDTQLRFRQFDPKWFSEFRTVTLADGIAAVYGKIAEAAQDEQATKASYEKSLDRYVAIRKINRAILKDGVTLLCDSAKTTVHKADDGEETEERFVLSMVLEPTDGTEGAPFKPDTQADVYSKSDVRKACHVWMEYYGAIDLMHSWRAIGKEDVRVLECYIAPCEFKLGDDTVLEGSWMLGIRVVNDDLWKAVKAGDLGAYSIGGTANRVPLEAA